MTAPGQPIDPSLEEELERDPGATRPVVVTFTEPQSPDDLRRLELYTSSEEASTVAYGELGGEAIRTLARRDDVAGISGAPVLPAPPSASAAEPGPARQGTEKIAPDLAMQLELGPDRPHAVIVTFRDPPGPGAMAELGLLEGSPTTGSGSLDAEAIRELAARDDVLQISWSAPPRLLGSAPSNLERS